DGSRIASCAKRMSRGKGSALLLTGELKVWDTATYKELRSVAYAGPEIPDNLAFSPDGKQLAMAGMNNAASVWDVQTCRETVTLRGHVATVNAVAFSPDGKYLVTGGRDQLVRVWDAATGQELYALRGHNEQVNAVVFATGGERPVLASASADATVKTWRPAD